MNTCLHVLRCVTSPLLTLTHIVHLFLLPTLNAETPYFIINKNEMQYTVNQTWRQKTFYDIIFSKNNVPIRHDLGVVDSNTWYHIPSYKLHQINLAPNTVFNELTGEKVFIHDGYYDDFQLNNVCWRFTERVTITGISGFARVYDRDEPYYESYIRNEVVWAKVNQPAIEPMITYALLTQRRHYGFGTMNYESSIYNRQIIKFVIPKGSTISEPFILAPSFSGDSDFGGGKKDSNSAYEWIEYVDYHLEKICPSLQGQVDLDIVHPATGELADAKEDIDDGGYVSVQRLEDPSDPTSDVTPKTKVKIHAVAGAQSTWKTRLKFTGTDRYKIYRDEARTQEVLSEQTEFDATQDTTLFFHGLKKSVSRGGEQVTMQVKVGNDWNDGDSVKCTIVQSEFLIQVKAFIPYAWSEAEEIPVELNLVNPMAGKVVKGDLHAFTSPRSNGRPASPGFRNRYSTDREPSGVPGDPTHDLFDNAPFRVCQKIILTPYKDLHPSYDLASGRKLWTAPSSDHYVKATSVNAAEISLKKGFMSLSGGASAPGKPPITIEDYRQGARASRVTELHIEAAGKDGAMPWGTTWATADIHWDMWVKIDSEADPLLPTIQFGGSHDSYPAYEIIVIQSNGTYKPIHNVSPAASAYPGPSSLDDNNAINIGRSDTINQ